MNLYVGNLSFKLDEQKLTETFAQYGSVEQAKIVVDHETGRSKGFGFVKMSTEEAGKKAISELDGKDLLGRPLKVNEARPRT